MGFLTQPVNQSRNADPTMAVRSLAQALIQSRMGAPQAASTPKLSDVPVAYGIPQSGMPQLMPESMVAPGTSANYSTQIHNDQMQQLQKAKALQQMQAQQAQTVNEILHRNTTQSPVQKMSEDLKKRQSGSSGGY